jgi:hypothetical protein
MLCERDYWGGKEMDSEDSLSDDLALGTARVHVRRCFTTVTGLQRHSLAGTGSLHIKQCSSYHWQGKYDIKSMVALIRGLVSHPADVGITRACFANACHLSILRLVPWLLNDMRSQSL